ncbi:MAG: S41 family peptidase [Anaerolineales bacterium]
MTFAIFTASCGGAAEPTQPLQQTSPTDSQSEHNATDTPPQTGPLATAAALFGQITLNPPTPPGGVEVSGPDDYVGLFQQGWNIVNDNYVRDNFNGVDWNAVYDTYLPRFEAVSNQQAHWDLMSNLIGELRDQHSRFVAPNELQNEFSLGNSLPLVQSNAATGIEIWPGPGREDEVLAIWNVCSDSPAADAGLERGDVILAINNATVVSPQSTFYVPASYGPAGGSVTLRIQGGETEQARNVELYYTQVSGCYDWRHALISENPRIGYIVAPDFDGDAAHEIFSRIQEMEKGGALDGLIVDVRHNPGGNSDESSGVFAEGIVGTEGPLREGKQRTIYRIRGPVEWNTTTSLVILTDGSSHSASEYFAASLIELDRAITIGTNTAGNTEGIVGFILSDGSLVRLAITTLLLNDGTGLEGIGVTPDIEILLGEWGLAQKPYDAQLQAAIAYLSQ